MQEIKKILQIPAPLDQETRAKKACALAKILIKKSGPIKTKKNIAFIYKNLKDINKKAFLINLIDISFRSKKNKIAALKIKKLLKRFKRPFLPFTKFLLFFFFCKKISFIFVPLIKRSTIDLFKELLIQKKSLKKFLKKNKDILIAPVKDGCCGKKEIKKHLNRYLYYLKKSDIFVRVSTLSSKLNYESFIEEAYENLKKLLEQSKGKKIILDMEHSKYFSATIEIFKKALQGTTEKLGIILQAYLPETYTHLQELLSLNKPFSIFLVKGAYLSFEKVLASKKETSQRPYLTKIETDANFKKMLLLIFQKDLSHINLVICTHNIFDIAFSLVLQKEYKKEVSFCMLGKISSHIKTTLEKFFSISICSYIAVMEDFNDGVYFILRRLEEISGNENFLRYLPKLSYKSSSFELLQSIFLQSIQEIENLSHTPRYMLKEKRKDVYAHFENQKQLEPFSKDAIETEKKFLEKYKNKKIEKKNFFKEEDFFEKKNLDNNNSLKTLIQILLEKKEDFIHSIMVDSLKTFKNACYEFHKSIDIIKYYTIRQQKFSMIKDTLLQPKGTFFLSSSFTYPLSESLNKIIGALLYKNTIIVQSDLFTSYLLVESLYKAGFSKEDIFLKEAASKTSPSDFKVNKMIITSLCDKYSTVQNLVKSAFSLSGQNLSKTSIAIIEKEVFYDEKFISNLIDAVKNLSTGPTWDTKTDIPPLKEVKKDVLEKIFSLKKGEKWILKPVQDSLDAHLFSCGIVQTTKDSFLFNTPTFFPVLGIIKVNNFSEALSLFKNTQETSVCLQSLDEEEHLLFKQKIHAKNYYINRATVKNMIRRQPFSTNNENKSGGPNFILQFCNKISVSLPKEKSPINEKINSLSSFLENIDLSAEELGIWYASISNYSYFWNRMKSFKDPSKIIGQDNFFGYKPIKFTLRITEKTKPLDALLICAASLSCSACLKISFEKSSINWFALSPLFKVQKESREEFYQRVKKEHIKNIRTTHASSINKDLPHCYINDKPPLFNGRYELLNYLTEETISIEYHRNGNLGTRESELRKPLT